MARSPLVRSRRVFQTDLDVVDAVEFEGRHIEQGGPPSTSILQGRSAADRRGRPRRAARWTPCRRDRWWRHRIVPSGAVIRSAMPSLDDRRLRDDPETDGGGHEVGLVGRQRSAVQHEAGGAGAVKRIPGMSGKS